MQSAAPPPAPFLPTWAIILIATGAVVLALCLLLLALELYWKAQRKAQESECAALLQFGRHQAEIVVNNTHGLDLPGPTSSTAGAVLGGAEEGARE